MSIKLIAFDLDGTLTQHKTKLCEEHKNILSALSEKYKLIMVGAGQCGRIFEQMNGFPIDIIGNYGMQMTKYNEKTGESETIYDICVPCDRLLCEERVTRLRERYGYSEFKGENVEYHTSGCITFPILGTAAEQKDKLSFDPDRKKRRTIYDAVASEFPEFNVFVGGSSSFDMAPKPYNKYYALERYCRENNILHSETVFVGDDYGEGGNDESVYRSDFGFIKVDNYLDFPKAVEHLL